MQEIYKILNLSENATKEEVEASYKILKEKYSKDRFLEGEAGNEAAKNLTKLENAYSDYLSSSTYFSDDSNGNVDFSSVENAIKSGDYNLAQSLLDDITDRNAEWHYLQSVIFYKKNWHNESKKQLEIAINMDPSNSKYKNSYNVLKEKMEFAEKQFHSGNNAYNNAGNVNNRQMGGSACGEFADCCTTWCCINLLCNGCCR